MAKIEKFEGHPAANCYIINRNDGGKILRSYSTTVAEIDADGWVTVHGLYSRTTIKHIGWFMRSLGSTYQIAKQLAGTGNSYNIYTGEYSM